MTLEQLRVFVAVAERQHVTRAARALNLAQSAASAAIAALESYHGTKLFHRVGRRIELTEAGRVFSKEARAVLARAEAAELCLAELAGLERGAIAVHASQTIASYWLPRHLVAFRMAHPGIEIRLSVGNSRQVADAVYEGVSELGFVEGTISGRTLKSHQVARDRLKVVVGPEHPWATRTRITPADILEAEWVLREPGSGTRAEFESALAERGISPSSLRVALELPTNESVRAAVESGMGATALSASVIVASIEAGLLHPVAFNLPDRGFHVLYHTERTLSHASAALLNLVAK